MKKYIFVACFSLFLIACSSTEKKTGSAAIEYLEEIYHIDEEIKIISAEKVSMPIHPLVSTLDVLFNGRDYNVVLEVNESIPFQVESVVNQRSLEVKDINYIEAKHEVFQKENQTYQHMMQELKEFGVEDIHIYDTYFDDITKTIYNHIILNETYIDTDEYIHILDQMSEMIIESRQTDISIKMAREVRQREYDNLTIDTRDVSLPAHSKDEYKEFAQLVDNQLSTLSEASLIDEKLIKEFEAWEEEYNIELISSTISDLERDTSVYPIKETFRHELKLKVLEGYEMEELLDVIHLLEKKGFHHTYVDIQFTNEFPDFYPIEDMDTFEKLEAYKDKQ